jgi:hypothetical protein
MAHSGTAACRERCPLKGQKNGLSTRPVLVPFRNAAGRLQIGELVRRLVVEGHRLAAVLADPEGIDTKPRRDCSGNVTLRDLVAVRNANLIRG